MKITKRQLRKIIHEAILTEEPTEIMLSGEEVRQMVKRGDTLIAKEPMELADYRKLGRRVKVKVGDSWSVDAVGSGSGPDDVIGWSSRGQVIIPPYYLSNFGVMETGGW